MNLYAQLMRRTKAVKPLPEDLEEYLEAVREAQHAGRRPPAYAIWRAAQQESNEDRKK